MIARSIWLTAGLIVGQSVAGPALDRAIEHIGPPAPAEQPLPLAPPDVQASLAAHIQGQAARSRGDHREALVAWRDAVLADPRNAAAWRGIAQSSSQLGLRDAAASAWKRRLDLMPSDAHAQGVIGESLARSGNWDAALPLLLACRGQDVEAQEADSTTRWRRALLIMEGLANGGFADASIEVAQSLELGVAQAATIDPPTDANDARWLFLIQLMVEQGQFTAGRHAASARAAHADAIERNLRAAARSRARASAARFHAAVLAVMAREDVAPADVHAYMDTHAREEGIRLAPLIRYDMPVAEALWRTGGIALQLGNGSLARSLMQQAVNLEGNDPRFRNSLGWVLLVQDGPTEAAASHLEAAVESAPDDAAALDSLGLLRFRQGRVSEAVLLLQQARALAIERISTRDQDNRSVEDPEILLHLGDALVASGDAHGATVIWMLAMEQLTGPIGRWRLANQPVIQRKEWGLEVIAGEELYDLRFGELLGTLRMRLASVPLQEDD